MVLTMTAGQIRVIDPILTQFYHGYMSQSDLHVWNLLFPEVLVDQSGGQVIEFSKEAFRLYNTRRAPGSSTARIDFGYTGRTYTLDNEAIEALVPDEWQRDALAVPGIDLAQQALALVGDSVRNRLEYDAAVIAQDNISYPAGHIAFLSGTAKFSHASSDPIATVDVGRERIRSKTGRYPNLAIAGPIAHNAIKNNPTIKALFTNKDNQDVVVNESMVAQALSMPVYRVGAAVYADSADVFQDCWGNNLILAYVPNLPIPGGQTAAQSLIQANMGSRTRPSYGYTYTLKGNPYVKEPYYENNRESWVYGTHYERKPQITSGEAGYIIRGVA